MQNTHTSFLLNIKLAVNKPSLKGKVANRRFDGRVFDFSPGEGGTA